MSVIIQGTGKALPEKCMKNTEIASVIDTSDDWIKSHTGITSRRVASETDTSATLASAACMSALQNACERGAVGLNADSVDLILCATATPQYSGFPSNACLIQQALGAHNAACFDLSAACSGFLYALDTAASLMERLFLQRFFKSVKINIDRAAFFLHQRNGKRDALAVFCRIKKLRIHRRKK